MTETFFLTNSFCSFNKFVYRQVTFKNLCIHKTFFFFFFFVQRKMFYILLPMFKKPSSAGQLKPLIRKPFNKLFTSSFIRGIMNWFCRRSSVWGTSGTWRPFFRGYIMKDTVSQYFLCIPGLYSRVPLLASKHSQVAVWVTVSLSSQFDQHTVVLRNIIWSLNNTMWNAHQCLKCMQKHVFFIINSTCWHAEQAKNTSVGPVGSDRVLTVEKHTFTNALNIPDSWLLAWCLKDLDMNVFKLCVKTRISTKYLEKHRENI